MKLTDSKTMIRNVGLPELVVVSELGLVDGIVLVGRFTVEQLRTKYRDIEEIITFRAV